MKEVFKVGDEMGYCKTVEPADVAQFHGKIIHPVCATFALARDVEWTSRQFVLKMCDEDEEGIGTMLSIHHRAPAFVGDEIIFRAFVEQITGPELVCTFEATVGDRLIALGKTGQRIMKRKEIKTLFGFL